MNVDFCSLSYVDQGALDETPLQKIINERNLLPPLIVMTDEISTQKPAK
jgi:hypothetical protein